MMGTAQTRARYHRRLGRRLPLDEPPIRRVLLEGIVNPVLVVVAHVVPEQPAKMLFVQGNDMVQDHVAVRGGFGKRFTQLWDDPVRSRMARTSRAVSVRPRRKTRITARMERMNCGTNSPW